MPRKHELLYDPRDYHIPDSKQNELSKEEMDEMRDNFFRRWPPFLTGSEMKIVLFIYDRTVNYGRRWAYVSIETLVEGYPLKDFRSVIKRIKVERDKYWRTLSIQEQTILSEGQYLLTAPTGLSRRQIINSLSALETRGFVYRIMNNGQPEMSLNPHPMFDYREHLIPKRKK